MRAPLGAVPAVEGKGLVGLAHLPAPGRIGPTARTAGWFQYPLCHRDLRAFPALRWRAYPFGGTAFSVRSAFQSVLNARSFCLRDSGAVAPSAATASATLSRASSERTGAAVGCWPGRVNAPPRLPGAGRDDAGSARGVVAQLVGGQLEAEQDLEAGALDGGADGGIGHRIDRGVGRAGAAIAGDLPSNILGQGRGRAQNARGRRPRPCWCGRRRQRRPGSPGGLAWRRRCCSPARSS